MPRPLGVTVLAIFALLAGTIQVVGGLGVLLGITVAATPGAGLVLLVLGLINLAVGVGLWMLQNWARLVTLVIAVIQMLAGVVALVMAPGLAPLLAVAIYGVIAWYLMQPHVRAAFGRGVPPEQRMAA